MKKGILLLSAVCLLLCGCQFMDGRYASITPHEVRSTFIESESNPASSYMELRSRLVELVSNGLESGLIYTVDYTPGVLKTEVEQAIHYVVQEHPIGSYAVKSIDFEVGTNSGQMVVALNIQYHHSRTEILQIESVADMKSAEKAIYQALDNCDVGMVLQVTDYRERDFTLLVENYAAQNPDKVMEIPQVTVSTYPETGKVRVLEIKFSYETSRDSLRSMQEQIKPLFASAALYVSEDATDFIKYSQLYSFLMERFDYEIATSITPAYSLLRHGVGDSEAFASVYACICSKAGMECMVVSGTRDAEAWYWNIVCDSGEYYHVDLLRCHQDGGYRERFDSEMSGYVWDYAAYPACVPVEIEPPPTEPAGTEQAPAQP